MFKVLAKQHCDAVTPLSNGYKLEYSDGIFNTFLLGKCVDTYESVMTIANTLYERFDGEYNESDGCVYVNEENVYDIESTECIVDGVHIFMADDKDIPRKKTEWIKLSNAVDSDIKLKVSSDDCVLNVQDDVSDLYLQNLDLFYLYDLVRNNSLIGRKVFWLDPCAFDDREHTSDWKTITEIEDGIITLDDATEVYPSECYI